MADGLTRRIFLQLALAGGAWALGACRPAASAPAQGSADDGPRRLRVGFSGVDMSKLPYQVGLARLREQGFELDTPYLESAVITFKALIAGELDLAVGAVAAAIQANQTGGDRLRVFCSVNPLTDYVLVAAPEITTLQGLLGRRFGVARLGSISHFVPRVVLQRSGLDPDAVEWIAVGGTTARRAAMASGAIVAGVMHLEEALLAEREGYRILFEAAKLLPEYISDGLVAKDSFLGEHPALGLRITTAMIDAARWTLNEREAALAFARQHLGTSADDALLAAAYDTLARNGVWSASGGLTPETMTATMQEELAMQTIERPMPWEEWATLAFINQYAAARER